MNNYERNESRRRGCGCGCANNDNWPQNEGCGCGNNDNWPQNNGCGCENRRRRCHITAETETEEFMRVKIHGHVRGRNGCPLENVEVILLKCNCRHCRRIATTRTDENGHFCFETFTRGDDNKFRLITGEGCGCNGNMMNNGVDMMNDFKDYDGFDNVAYGEGNNVFGFNEDFEEFNDMGRCC